jgi:hypothetical protein
MALTFLRWLVAATLGCAFVWYGALVRGGAVERSTSDNDSVWPWIASQARPLFQIQSKIAATNARLRSLELRDSVSRVAPRQDGLTIIVDPAVTPLFERPLDSLVRERWSRLQISGGRRTIIAVVADTAYRVHGLPREMPYGLPITTFVPGPETGGACISILHLSPLSYPDARRTSQVRRSLSSPGTTDALASSCAFFARFGSPGQRVHDWLARSSWLPATYAAWDREADTWQPPAPRGHLTDAVERFTLQGNRSSRIRQLLLPTGVGCIAGERAACARALFTQPPTRDSSWLAGVMTTSAYSNAFFYERRPRALGPGERWVLSEMVRKLGPERFQQFWSSPLAPDAAFEKALGQPVDIWLSGWMRRMYGDATVGPELPSTGIAAGLLILAVSLGGAILIGVRRHVV